MTTKTRSIINAVRVKNNELPLASPADVAKAEHIYEKMEEDKYKTESEKQHDLWRRTQKRGVYIMQNNIRAAKPPVNKPGLQFEAPLRVLVERYKDIDTIFKHCSLGQLNKYYTEGKKVFRCVDSKLVYDEDTGECFE